MKIEELGREGLQIFFFFFFFFFFFLKELI